MLLQFNVTPLHSGEQFYDPSNGKRKSREIIDRRKIAQMYIKSWFIIDLLSCINAPILIIFHISGQSGVNIQILGLLKALRLPRLLKLLRFKNILQIFHVSISVQRWFLYSRWANIVRLGWLLLFILQINHYLCCAWYAVFADGEWLKSKAISGLWSHYVTSFYYSLLLIMGADIGALFNNEKMFSSFAIILGAGLIAIFIGNVTMLITGFYANQTKYHKKMVLLLLYSLPLIIIHLFLSLYL